MISHIYKPRRKRNGKTITSRLYRGRYRLEGEFLIQEVSLGTSDKQVAEKKLREIIRQKELEKAGIVADEATTRAARKPLVDHLIDFVEDLKARRRTRDHVLKTSRRIRTLIQACGWKIPADVTPDSFVAWRSKQSLAPKTLNEYLNSVSNLLNWMVTQERTVRNPLAKVVRVETKGQETVRRRALTEEELRRLIVAAEPHRSAVYLAAAYTGLRRGELDQLVWSDVYLDEKRPYLLVRASTTKNKKAACLPLHVQLSNTLKGIRPQNATASTKVFFKGLPDNRTLRRDMDRTGIPYMDEMGRKVDFHALRYTFATALARAGVSQRTAQELMRHSDPKLTAKVYTDASQLPTFDAVEALPWLGWVNGSLHEAVADDTVIAPQNADISGLFLSQTVKDDGLSEAPQSADEEVFGPENRALSRGVNRAPGENRTPAFSLEG